MFRNAFPAYEEKPLNLAYYFSEKSDECTPIYMYLHRAAPVKGKYIASVRVATYNPDQSWSKEEREANNTFSNDLCYISLLGSSSEILNQSLALYSTDARYNTTDKSCTDAKNWDSTIGSASYNTKAAFLGVTYTNNPAKAIHGLLRYRAKDGATPPESIVKNARADHLAELKAILSVRHHKLGR